MVFSLSGKSLALSLGLQLKSLIACYTYWGTVQRFGETLWGTPQYKTEQEVSEVELEK